jgi:hypothetical protein
MKPSPAQLRTCIVRISKVAKEILQKEVDKNGSSIADELDKKLSIGFDESNDRFPLSEAAQRGFHKIYNSSRHIGSEPIIIVNPQAKDELDKKLGIGEKRD